MKKVLRRRLGLLLALTVVLTAGAAEAWHDTDCEPIASCIRAAEVQQQKRGGLGLQIRVVEEPDTFRPRAYVAVGKVFAESPAARAGLRADDGIIALNSRVLGERDAAFFLTFHRDLEIGTEVHYTIVRDDAVLEIAMTAGPRHPEAVKSWMIQHLRAHHPPAHLASYTKLKGMGLEAAEPPK